MKHPWVERAACRQAGTDPELFFPVSESGPAAARQIAAAKAICARCPVAEQCLDWALLAGESAGIWGGTTPDERRLLRRALQAGLSSPAGLGPFRTAGHGTLTPGRRHQSAGGPLRPVAGVAVPPAGTSMGGPRSGQR